MTDAVPWICPTCSRAVSTPYCPACGERALRARELTLRGFFDQLVQAFTSIDGRLIRSFRWLVTRPGFLTVAYLQGRRKPYLGPIQVFLIANVLFFATESLTGGRIFTAPLDSHLHNQPWGAIANRLVSDRLATTQTTLDLYAPAFNGAMARNARSFIIVMALAFAFAPSLAFRRSGRPSVTHVVFSLHLYAFLLLLFCVATVVPVVDLRFGGLGFASETLDLVVSISLLLACAVYLYAATGPVYGAHGVMRGIKAAVLTVAVAGIVLGYRFALLLVTLYST